MTAKDFLINKNHTIEAIRCYDDNLPNGRMDIIQLMEKYHQHQLKLLNIHSVVVPKGTLHYPYKHQLKRIDQLNQTQASLSQQLQILRHFANKLGLYDASDYLKKK